jgi:hypothetical protein
MTTRFWSACLAAAALVACGGDDEPTVESLSGLWNATRAEFTAREGPAQSIDLVAEGWTVTLNVNDNGAFLLTATPPEGEVETIGGLWSNTSDTFTMSPDALPGVEWVFDLDIGNDEMTLSGGSVLYDIDGDDVDEEASLTLELVRD